MLAVFILPALIVWLSAGASTDHTQLAFLGASILSGLLAYVKETLGTASPVVPPGSVATTVVTKP